MPRLEHVGDIFVLTLGDDENRFSPDWVTATRALIEEVATTPGPAALVTVADGKFWSNGLDLGWIGSHLEQADAFMVDVQALLARVLTLPVPTVAAIQGHCFAAGAMLALAHDWRVMRRDRGFFCLPEVDLGLPFTVGMDALNRAKLSAPVALEAMTTGRRYGGADAESAGIVSSAVEHEQVLAAALAIAEPLAVKAGPALGTIKARMFADVVRALSRTDGLTHRT